MKVFKKEDGVYWIVLAIIVLILYFVFSDGQFSLIFTLAGTVQTFGFALVVLKIRKSRSVAGLSRETFICYTIIFAIRAVLFLKFKVSLRKYRDIYPMTPLAMSSSVYKSSQLHYFLDIFFIAFALLSERVIVWILILSSLTI